MSLVYVQTNEHLAVDERESGDYGRWKKVTDYAIDGVVLDTAHRWGYEAIQIAPAVVEGDEVWVLYMTYFDGDSLGIHRGHGEVLWVFVDEQVAKVAEQKLRPCTSETSMFHFVDEDGEDIYLSNPANDYFSDIECFHLQKFIVGDCPNPRY